MDTPTIITVEWFNEHFDRLPVNYRNSEGIEFVTFVTSRNNLYDFYMSIGSDNRIKKDFRNLKNSPLNELGFRQLTLFLNPFTGERIALLAVD